MFQTFDHPLESEISKKMYWMTDLADGAEVNFVTTQPMQLRYDQSER
jgi:hypothetical protein